MENNNINFNKFTFYNSNCRDIFFKRPLPNSNSLFDLFDKNYFQFKLEGFKDINITLKCEWVVKEDDYTTYLLIDFEQKNKDKYFTADDVYKYKKYLEEFLYLLLDEYIFIEKVSLYKNDEEINNEIFKINIHKETSINLDGRYLFDLYETRNYLQKYFYKYVEFRNKSNDSYGLFTIINENLNILCKNPSVYEIIGMASLLYVFLTEELFNGKEKEHIDAFNNLLISLETNNNNFINNFFIKAPAGDYRDFIKTTFIKARDEMHHSIKTNYNVSYDYYKIIFVLTKLYFFNKEIGIDITKEKITFEIFYNIKEHNKADIIKGYITSYIFKYLLKELNIKLFQMKSFSHEVFKDFVDNFHKKIDFVFHFQSNKHHIKNPNDYDIVMFLKHKMVLEVVQRFEENGSLKINSSIKDLILKNEELKNYILDIKTPLVSDFNGMYLNNKKAIKTVNTNIEDNYKDIIRLQKLVKCIMLLNDN